MYMYNLYVYYIWLLTFWQTRSIDLLREKTSSFTDIVHSRAWPDYKWEQAGIALYWWQSLSLVCHHALRVKKTIFKVATSYYREYRETNNNIPHYCRFLFNFPNSAWQITCLRTNTRFLPDLYSQHHCVGKHKS